MTLESPTDVVIYRSRLNAKINRNFEVFSATDFLAAITPAHPRQRCPDGLLLRLVFQQNARRAPARPAAGTGVPPPGVSPPPPAKLPSNGWCDLILRDWHVDPLRCPVCQNPMRVIAVIDDRRVVEKILRHLGA